MTRKRYIQTLLLAALTIWCCLVVSCSDTDDSGSGQIPDPTSPTIPTIPESSGEPLTVSGLTRGTGDEDINNENLSIWIMAVPTKLESDETEKTVQQGVVTYNGSWNSNVYVKNDRQYEIFGFLPYDIAESSSVDMENYSVSSTTINLNNMKSLSDEDVCMITGAITACPDSLEPADWLQRGSYYYQPLFLAEEANNNNHKRFGVRLLADHLYASVRFKIFVNSDYNARRTIKLREMKLTTPKVKATVNASITLNKSRGTTTPFTIAPGQVTIEPGQESTGLASLEVFKYDAGQEIKTAAAYTAMSDEDKANYINIKPGYFGAWLIDAWLNDNEDDLYLESTYDVYDKKGNLIRGGCTAKNRLTSKLVHTVSETEVPIKPGERVTITLTVNPTYLYVLSDPELDNPQVTLE